MRPVAGKICLLCTNPVITALLLRFGGNTHHDPHMLYTLSALQILALYDRLDVVDRNKVIGFIAGLQQPDGSFAGDRWGEIDTRFSYCAFSALSILGALDEGHIDKLNAVEFVVR